MVCIFARYPPGGGGGATAGGPGRACGGGSGGGGTGTALEATVLAALAAAEEVALVTHGDCGPSGVDGGAAVAGWGVALYGGEEDAVDLAADPLVTLFGPVVCPEAVRRRPPLAPFSLGAIVSNDSTSELSAGAEALLFVAEPLAPRLHLLFVVRHEA